MIIPAFKYTRREQTVADILRDSDGIETFLNVGFHDYDDPRRHWWIRICEANGIDWKILEIFGGNVDDAISKGCPETRIVRGSIMDTGCYDDVDCLLFWHGPEHIRKDEFLSALPGIERKVRKLIVFGMPLGNETQPAVYGNAFEEHISTWTEDDWKALGYGVMTVVDRRHLFGRKREHITAYKRMGSQP